MVYRTSQTFQSWKLDLHGPSLGTGFLRNTLWETLPKWLTSESKTMFKTPLNLRRNPGADSVPVKEPFLNLPATGSLLTSRQPTQSQPQPVFEFLRRDLY